MAEHYIGTGAEVGIACNAITSGTHWSGTPGTAVVVRPTPGGLKWTDVTPMESVEEMRTDDANNVQGGTYYKGSVEMVASYLGMELWLQQLMDGAITTTGASDPRTHTQALSEHPLLYSAITYYRRLRDGSAKSLAFTNCRVTGGKFSWTQGQAGKVSFDWVGAVCTPGTTAIPTPVECEPILFSHIVPSINSVTTHRLKSFSFEIGNPATEGDFTQANALDHIERSGMRTLNIEAEFLHDAAVDTLAAVKSGIPMSILFDNGLLTTFERELCLTVGAAFREGLDETDAVWGAKTTSLKWVNRLSAAPWGIYTKNAADTIP